MILPVKFTGRVHTLKLLKEYYEESYSGRKTFEIRHDDRNYHLGDILELREFDIVTLQYTGRQHYMQITYILNSTKYLREGYVCLGLKYIPTIIGRKYCNEQRRKKRT